MSAETIAALGAAVASVGSGASVYFGMKMLIRRGEEDCQKRFDAFREGLKLRDDA